MSSESPSPASSPVSPAGSSGHHAGQETPHRYTSKLADALEHKWQGWWEQKQTFKVPNPGEAGFDAARPKFYCLDMFPYPSGAGLHVGHPEGYTATDIICRYKRSKGFNVLHPMGWDAFGLPAEQYAIATGVHPAITTKTAIENFRRQLSRFGFCYDWSRQVGTIDPEYYKWTQWIFLKVYGSWFDLLLNKAQPIAMLIEKLQRGEIAPQVNPQADEVSLIEPAPSSWQACTPKQQRTIIDSYRLAYLGETTVNWCPKLGTVLANDEVIDGKSERGGYPVLRKPMKQWMIRITAFADRLLAGLETVAWPESTKTMQREWIGRSEGAEIDFSLADSSLGGLPPGGTTLRVVSTTEQSQATSTASISLLDSLARIDFDRLCESPNIIRKPAAFEPRDPYPAGERGPAGGVEKTQRELPHLTMPGATYFVTWRTEPTIELSEQEREIVLQSVLHVDGLKCDVFAATVMSNHVHVLLKPWPNSELQELITSVKKFSATAINKTRNRQGRLWQAECMDHIVRDVSHFAQYVAYVLKNPVEAKLVEKPSEYPFTVLSAKVLGLQAAIQRHHAERGATQHQQPALRVFTTRPDTLFGATYMVVAPEHPLVEQVLSGQRTQTRDTQPAVAKYVVAARNRSDVERMESKEKTGVDLGVDAINPATGKAIPIWVADYVLMGYGTGAIMAVPAHDERDYEFARAFKLPIFEVVQPPAGVTLKDGECFAGEGVAINSAGPDVSIDGLPTAQAKQKIIAWLEASGRGTRKVNHKLRDWTFSRQRYWGEPFPIVYDAEGNHHAVSEANLPVMLPELRDYAPEESEDPKPLLAKAGDWVRLSPQQAGLPEHLGPLTRETNTMPGSAGSSWYFLRYCDPANDSVLASTQSLKYWTNVDLYMGGSEHTVGHLLYSRMWNQLLFDLGHVTTPEPFQRLVHQGMITSFAYERADKSLVPTDQVTEVADGQYIETATGAKLKQIVAKMSKSLKNVVNPDDIIADYGADTFRLYEMYMGPLEASKPWNTKDIIGPHRFLQRLWRSIVDEQTGATRISDEAPSPELEKLLHRTIAGVTSDIDNISLHTAIAKLIELNNEFTRITALAPLPRRAGLVMCQLLAPFCPHIAEELWQRLGQAPSIVDAPWPTFDPALLIDSEVEMPVQVLGKVRGKIMVPRDADAQSIEALALKDPAVQKYLEGKTPKKVIVVPGRMINFVI